MSPYINKLESFGLVATDKSTVDSTEPIIIMGGAESTVTATIPGIGDIVCYLRPFRISQEGTHWLLDCSTNTGTDYEVICHTFDEAVNKLVAAYHKFGFLPKEASAT